MGKVKRTKQFATLHEYLDLTGTNQAQLRALVLAKTGKVISAPLLSMILRGSRRCSRMNAFAIYVAIDQAVPMEELTRWPRTLREDDQELVKPQNTAA